MKLRIFHIFVTVCSLFGFRYMIINFIERGHVNTYYCSLNDSSQCRIHLIKRVKTSTRKTIVTYTPYVIKMILEHTRSKIYFEFSQFNNSEIGPLEDLVMELGGQPRRSLIISTWRSGTTFLGQALNAIPSTYYNYEPLLSFGIKQLRHIPEANEALRTIRNMMLCDHQNMTFYFEHGSKNLNQFKHNKRLWNHCKYKLELCFDAEFTSQFCRLFPFQTMKVIRVRLSLITKILDDKELNTKVILLIRDPRGVMQSRQHRQYCKMSPDCWEPSILCADMVNDYVIAWEIMTQFPDRLMVVRFEELALEPNITMHRVLKFLSLVATKPFYEFLHNHTNKEIANISTFSTIRLSRNVPFRWKDLLDFNYVNKIQKACENAMLLWGYKIAQNETHMKSKDFIPITNVSLKSR